MNPLPRILGMALLVVLATLFAVLAGPAWLRPRAEPAAAPAAVPGSVAPAASQPGRLAELPLRTALVLAVIGFALAVILVFSQSARPSRAEETKPALAAARSEISTLARLAETSVAQGAELSRERDVRRRAEEDAQLKQQLLTASLEEKIRLGHDLHDGIIQSLYAAGLTLESVRALVISNPAEADRRLEQTRAAINATIRDVRTYITGLTPENLRREGFAQAVETQLLELQAGRDVSFDLKIDPEAATRLTPEQSLQMLQIIREAVSNALRHGGASRITLRLHPAENALAVLVQDNGVGFDPAQRRDGGHGLNNMRARAERLGATLNVTSRPGEGARVVVTLPLIQTAAVV